MSPLCGVNYSQVLGAWIFFTRKIDKPEILHPYHANKLLKKLLK